MWNKDVTIDHLLDGKKTITQMTVRNGTRSWTGGRTVKQKHMKTQTRRRQSPWLAGKMPRK